MSVYIFVEGGGDQRTTLTKCREAFSKYCAQVAPAMHLPRIVACGGRQQAFDRFRTAVLNAQPEDINVLLVDAEASVTHTTSVEHLNARDGWRFPTLGPHKVFLMVQAMEAWFLADRETLGDFYNGGFHERSLPGSAEAVELIRKNDLEPSLRHASRHTLKGEYHKVKHGFELLGRIRAEQVERASQHASNFHEFLRTL